MCFSRERLGDQRNSNINGEKTAKDGTENGVARGKGGGGNDVEKCKSIEADGWSPQSTTNIHLSALSQKW